MLNIQTELQLQDLINQQVEENIHLDYKASGSLSKSDGKKKEITKDVSAFANSDGGTIIYGIKEFDDAEKRHLPESISPVIRQDYSKEWLEQVINSGIQPKIQGVTITPIPIENSAEKVVYIVNIPKSSTSHQASDFRYYKRYNFESIPMHDYEVRDVMNRDKFPVIDLAFEIEQYTYEVTPQFPPLRFPMSEPVEQVQDFRTSNTLRIYAWNNGGVYANYVNCFIEIPCEFLDVEEYKHLDKYEKDGIQYRRIYCDNTIREVKEVTNLMSNTYYKYWPSRYDPILPETRFKLDDIRLRTNKELKSGKIHWTVNADNSAKKFGEIAISEIEIHQKSVEEED